MYFLHFLAFGMFMGWDLQKYIEWHNKHVKGLIYIFLLKRLFWISLDIVDFLWGLELRISDKSLGWVIKLSNSPCRIIRGQGIPLQFESSFQFKTLKTSLPYKICIYYSGWFLTKNILLSWSLIPSSKKVVSCLSWILNAIINFCVLKHALHNKVHEIR